MDRGARQAAVHGAAQSDKTKATQHTQTVTMLFLRFCCYKQCCSLTHFVCIQMQLPSQQLYSWISWRKGMYICNSDIRWQNNHCKNLWTLICWQPHCRDGTPVIHRSSALFSMNEEAEEYSRFKSQLYILFCEVPVLIHCHSAVFTSSIFRSALYLKDLHFDFNKY